VHVAENPAGSTELRNRKRYRHKNTRSRRHVDVGADGPGYDPHRQAEPHRGQGSVAYGGHDRLPGDRAQPVLERRRAHLPPEEPQHGNAGGQTQQRRAKRRTTDESHPN